MSSGQRFEADREAERERRIARIVDAEERYLQARRDEAGAAMAAPRIGSRRGFLAASVAALGAGTLARAADSKAPPGAVERAVPPDPTKVQGTPIGADGGYGSRSQFETAVRVRFPTRDRRSRRGR